MSASSLVLNTLEDPLKVVLEIQATRRIKDLITGQLTEAQIVGRDQ